MNLLKLPPKSASKGAGLIGAIFVTVGGLLTGTPVLAQEASKKPLNIVVPYTAGGASDTIARLIGQHWAERTGESVVIENRPGAGGQIALNHVKGSAPDGRTVMLISGASVLAYAFQNKTFDIKQELTPLGMLFTQRLVLVVNPNAENTRDIHNAADLVKFAKANPAALRYATSSPGTMGHLLMEKFKETAGIEMIHIPYKGSPQAVTNVIGGHVDMFLADLTSSLPHIQAGKLRPVVVGGRDRTPELPDVPTFIEQGFPTIVPSVWGGVSGPPGLSPEIVQSISSEIKAIFEKPEVQDRITASGNVPWYLGAAEMGQYVQNDFNTWNTFIRANGIQN